MGAGAAVLSTLSIAAMGFVTFAAVSFMEVMRKQDELAATGEIDLRRPNGGPDTKNQGRAKAKKKSGLRELDAMDAERRSGK